MKRCASAGCRELIDYSQSRCEKHRDEQEKSYNKLVRHNSNVTLNGKTNKEIADFYNSSEWKRKRKLVLIEQHYLCQNCLREGRLKEGNIVHHKIEVREKEGWKHRLSKSNLEVICQECHNKENHNSWKK